MDASVVYGVNAVLEALAAGVRVEGIYLLNSLAHATRDQVQKAAHQLGVKVLRTDKIELDKMTDHGVHQGVVARVALPDYLTIKDIAAIERKPRTLVVLLDEVQDPRNFGALARSALAFGASGMVVPGHRSVQITPAAVKASAGALCRIPVARVTNLGQAIDHLKEKGFWIAGTVGPEQGGQAPWELDPGDKVALVLGSEGEGLRHGIEGRLDFRVWIPMGGGAESLNVSVAGAILLYEWLGRGGSRSAGR
jgi:23S rRNA (guanosine2251-2'-O)-methyltransferase